MNIIKNYNELLETKTPLLIFDLETTGLNRGNDRIIEIGAIKVQNGVIVDTLSILVNPGIEVPYYATKVNGITTEMLTGAISDTKGVIKLIEMTKDCIVIAHNVSFDVGFINEYLKRMGLNILENRFVDTVRLARKAFPGHAKYSLGIIAKNLNIKILNAHRAADDARVCFELYQKCITKLKDVEKNKCL